MRCLTLPWPLDTGCAVADHVDLPGSNVVYDFHGDPAHADLYIVMEGNQFMVIPDLLAAFEGYVGRRVSVFYVTLPPPRFRPLIEGHPLAIGNLILNFTPQVVMGPPDFMEKIKEYLTPPETFMENRGVVLLVARGNPKDIKGPEDLLRQDVKIALSNPKTEVNSYRTYLSALAEVKGLEEKIAKEAFFSQVIHHREVPAFIYAGLADVAPLYFHFAYYYRNPRFFAEPLFDYVEFPAGQKATSLYQVALMKQAAQEDLAQAWVAFLKTPEARALYAAHGFAENKSELFTK